jgi:ribosomal protein L9
MKKLLLYIAILVIGVLTIALGISLMLIKNMTIFSFPYTPIILAGFVIFEVGFYFVTTNQLLISNKLLTRRVHAWNNINVHINDIGDSIVSEVPMGIILLDDEDRIAWTNKFVTKNFGTSIMDSPITSLTDDFVEKKKEKEKFEITKDNLKFEVIPKTELKTYYIFNITELSTYRQKVEDVIPCIGIIYLDNFNESISRYDITQQSTYKADILNTLGSWIDKYDAYLKQYQDERFIIFTNRAKLSLMQKDKFSIIELVTEVSAKRNIKIGISLGFACMDVSHDKLYDFAQSAIELAIKRGGFQAAVNIQGKQMEFYGGKKDSFNSGSSRVSNRIYAQDLKEYIEKASNIVVMGHIRSDADSFAGCLLVREMARFLNKPCYVVVDSSRVDNLVKICVNELIDAKSDASKSFIRTEDALRKMNETTLLVVVDVQVPDMVHSPEILAKAKTVINIDHHRTGEKTINANYIIVEPAASSTVELCLELMDYINSVSKIDATQATVMYAALIVDTTDFTARTTALTFDAAAKLIEYGADVSLVKRWLRKDFNRVKEINFYVSKAEIFEEHFAFVVTNDTFDEDILLSQIADELLLINNVRASFVIAKNRNGEVVVKARSYIPTNVQTIIEKIGGGGHIQMAAATVPYAIVFDIEQKLKQTIIIEYNIGGEEEMKIILLEDIKGRGLKDDIINVAGGFAQYLITEKKAVLASKEAISDLEKRKIKETKDRNAEIERMHNVKSQLEGKEITISCEVGPNDKMFGSVTSKQIAEVLYQDLGIALDKKKIDLPSDLNSLGSYTVTALLATNISANFTVRIIPKKQ